MLRSLVEYATGAITDEVYIKAIKNAQLKGISMTRGRVEFSQFLSPGWFINDLKGRIDMLNRGISLEEIKANISATAHDMVRRSRTEYDGRLQARIAKGFNLGEAAPLWADMAIRELSAAQIQQVVRSAATEAAKLVPAMVARQVKDQTVDLQIQVAHLVQNQAVMRELISGAESISEFAARIAPDLGRLKQAAVEFQKRRARYQRKDAFNEIELPLISRPGTLVNKYWNGEIKGVKSGSRTMAMVLAIFDGLGYTISEEDVVLLQPLVTRIISLGNTAGIDIRNNDKDVNFLRFVADCIKAVG